MKSLLHYIMLVMLVSSGLMASCQTKSQKNNGQSYRIAFYNVENLFDTIDDPLKDDAEFLPTGRIAWTSERYQVKLDRLSQVIAALAEDKPAAVIGLCEVENHRVLEELVASPSIVKYNYQIIHRESSDERGIDNALLYDANQFQVIATRVIPVDLVALGDKTRDILYVKGVVSKSRTDTLHIFVNHWPSRSEGKEISEPKRLVAARTLKNATDSLIRPGSSPKILIIGDFNDEPSDKSLAEGLQAGEPNGSQEAGKLYNLGYKPFKEGKGTLYYKDWDVFDQIIVNGELLNTQKGLYFPGREESIFAPDWLLFKSQDGNNRPNRTAAKEYYGGYSDHLPVYLDLILNR